MISTATDTKAAVDAADEWYQCLHLNHRNEFEDSGLSAATSAGRERR